ncbi:DUF3099 domain-containing protein [Pseudarthrobacter sp. H3Y2-7]|jgi:hypothetical protein|uniref:DUF3099 domain-containing protein n=1 Tax=Pseudarthrobacter TaxID=1742993 RepID=UPI0023B0A684|nr:MULTISPECIES: DUF3099 domain-containing protein [unclassified Pseudarthrobacter]MDE8669648.1 DUF3099 domain-containing protein [Pseudarthrobacter sp. H3Y2-7]
MTPENNAGEFVPGNPPRFSGDSSVHSITDAATAHSEDMSRRMRKYALAMGIRLVCLILVFVVDGWFKLVMVAGAVFLPWIAVVIANGSDKAEVHSDSLLDYVPFGELDSAEDVSGQEEDEPAPVLQGELVEDDDEPTHGQERRAS